MIEYLNKFLYIFPSRKSVLLRWFLIFILVSTMEVGGIGIIGPFIALANQQEIIQQNYWLNLIYTQIGLKQTSQFVVLVGIVVIFIFWIKSIFSWYTQARIFKFSYIQKEKLIARLMKGYLEAPYVVYLNKNSAQIIQNVIGQTNVYANSILSTLMFCASNFINIIAISILLCVVSPIAVFSLIFLIAPLVILFNKFKDKMSIWGQQLHEADQGIIRSVNHGLGGFKETRIIGCGEYFQKETVEQSRKYAEAAILFYAFKLSPRFIIEAILVTFLVGFTSIILILNQSIQDLTSTLSVFALASIRLIPAFTNFTTGISILRNSGYSLDRLYEDLQELDRLKDESNQLPMNGDRGSEYSPISAMNFTNEIVLDSITYGYPNASRNSLDRISLNLKKGQSIALIGKSGAGKTTLVDVILGLLTPQEGDIKVDGKSIYSNLRLWQNMIGYIPQSIFLIDDTVEKNIAFGVPEHLINQERLDKAIKAAQLADVVANLPNGVETKVGERGIMLSGGQRQRVGIARALYHEREILVLDEATSALDNETESLVTESIKSLSGTKTMIIIAHRLTTVEHCDRIYLMDKGKIVKSGTYQEVVLQDTSLQS